MLTLPSDKTVAATSSNGATVTYSASATDETDGTITPSCSPASGSTFPIGESTVNCSATDAAGNKSTGSFKVTVQDTAPVLSLPGDKTVEATSANGAAVTYSASATDAVDGSVAVNCTPISGSTFGLGATTVNCSATDKAGNKATGSFKVTVGDTTAPILSLPGDKMEEATGASGATVSYSASATDTVDGTVSVNCSPASGSTFPLGATTVDCSATDAAGNKATGSFKVTVQDTTAPELTLPKGVSKEATGPNGAVVTFEASAKDIVDSTVSVSCAPASGTTFALGATTVNCSATDAAGNKATGSFGVSVTDTTPPAVTVPANKTVEATGPSGATVTYSASAKDIVDGDIANVTCLPASGSTFGFGKTSVTCSAFDSRNNTGSSSFDVTVQDTTAPEIVAHANVTEEATGADGAIATYTSPATTDAVDGTGAASCLPASGTKFALGSTTVTCSAKDNAGNIATQTTFSVIIRDTTAPVISGMPADISKEATGSNGAAASWTAPTALDIVDGSVVVSCSPNSGSTFAVGTTTVNCSATDAAGNKASDKFTVTVIDTTAPTLSLPSNMTVATTDPNGKVVTYNATASDLVDGLVSVSCTPTSGSTFVVGTTTVNCSATDKVGNKSSGSFNVMVNLYKATFQAPIDGPSVLNRDRIGRVIPVKAEIFVNGTEIKTGNVTIQVVKASTTSTTTYDDLETFASTADTSGTMVWDAAGDRWQYNLGTSNLTAGNYQANVYLDDKLAGYFLMNMVK